MYMYEIYTFYGPSTMPGVLHMLCNLILIIALCNTHVYFYFTNGKNETLADYLICLRSNGKEMEMSSSSHLCLIQRSGSSHFRIYWNAPIALECFCLGEWCCH